MPQTLNIAVCEDEAAETVLLCDILNHSDIQNTYTVFTDADSFLASYEYGKYDLLLMDIYMKDSMTGIEAVSIIRETDADIPSGDDLVIIKRHFFPFFNGIGNGHRDHNRIFQCHHVIENLLLNHADRCGTKA